MIRLSQYKNYLDKNEAALFIGAGISAIAGCSGLQDICNSLIQIEAIKKGFKNQNNGLSPRETREIIAFCKSKLKGDEGKKFEGIMRNGLIPNPEKYIRYYLPFLRKIKWVDPFPPILTTNTDTCLVNTKEFDTANIFYESSDMTMANLKKGGIFHLHGYYEDRKNQVWDIFDYERRYKTSFKKFLCKVFQSRSTLFIGYSFGDSELVQQMAFAKKNNEQNGHLSPQHFALLPEDDFPISVNEEMYSELYNIKIIKYGERNKFVDLFSSWIDSNYNISKIGRDDQTMYMPRIV